MGLFQNAFYFAGVLYAVLYAPQLIMYFFAFIGLYATFHYLTPSGKFNPVRRKIMFSTWERSKEGNIHLKVELNCSKVQKYISKFDKADRPSITHVAVKALAECFNHSRDTLNGKIIFDKFVPFERVAVSVLVDIDNGKDLAVMTLEDCEKLTIKGIQEKVKARAGKIKQKKDQDHKQRIDAVKLLPPFIIRLSLKLAEWLSFNLGLDIKPLAIKKDAFGAGVVTSLGMLGVKDAFVPFTPFMNAPVILAVGQVEDKAIVQDGQVVVAPMINLNFTIDHRFIDGAKGKNLLKDIYDVFENPDKY